jgi:hypothetical protein
VFLLAPDLHRLAHRNHRFAPVRWRILVVALLAFGLWKLWSEREVSHPPGTLVQAEPEQAAVDGTRPISKSGYRIQPLESFALEARVLGAEHYRLGREAELSPVDLALGWGPMSDSAVLAKIDISQGNRFYYWRVEQFPIPRREIEMNSANMHMIPGNDKVARALASVRTGSVVRLEGYLVEVSASDGWRWRSSLTREDTGNGACELVWVERLEVM